MIKENSKNFARRARISRLYSNWLLKMWQEVLIFNR
jgi:hypothetical protein